MMAKLATISRTKQRYWVRVPTQFHAVDVSYRHSQGPPSLLRLRSPMEEVEIVGDCRRLQAYVLCTCRYDEHPHYCTDQIQEEVSLRRNPAYAFRPIPDEVRRHRQKEKRTSVQTHP